MERGTNQARHSLLRDQHRPLPAQDRHFAAVAVAQLDRHQDAAPVRDLVEQARRQIPRRRGDDRAVEGSAGDDLDVPDAFQVRPALLRKARDQLDPDHLARRADQPAHHRREPAGPGADLQHGLPRFQAEQVQQPQHVTRLRVGRGRQFARSVHVAHDLGARLEYAQQFCAARLGQASGCLSRTRRRPCPCRRP